MGWTLPALKSDSDMEHWSRQSGRPLRRSLKVAANLIDGAVMGEPTGCIPTCGARCLNGLEENRMRCWRNLQGHGDQLDLRRLRLDRTKAGNLHEQL